MNHLEELQEEIDELTARLRETVDDMHDLTIVEIIELKEEYITRGRPYGVGGWHRMEYERRVIHVLEGWIEEVKSRHGRLKQDMSQN